MSRRRDEQSRLRSFLSSLGPGLVTGAADDDPSGIATYSQTGAQWGLSAAWLMLFTLPLMTAVQEACGRIGAVKGQGLAAVARKRFDTRLVVALVALMTIANTLNIGADIAGMAAGAKLLVPVPFVLLAAAFAALIVGLEVRVTYSRYSKLLKWLGLALLAYPLTAFVVGQPWLHTLRETVQPQGKLNVAFLYIVTGVIGTTISPYLFFWEASQVVEEEKKDRVGPKGTPARQVSDRFVRRLRVDTTIGMVTSNVVAWFIVITTASVLFSHGKHGIASAADAARAIQPLVHSFPAAGVSSKAIFAIGIIGLGLLAVPTLAGSAAYGCAEVFHWPKGLDRSFSQAKGFYGIIIVATAAGLAMDLAGIDPIKALVVSAVFNGVAAVPLVLLVGLIARDRHIMGKRRSGVASQVGVFATFAVMASSTLALAVAFIASHF